MDNNYNTNHYEQQSSYDGTTGNQNVYGQTGSGTYRQVESTQTDYSQNPYAQASYTQTGAQNAYGQNSQTGTQSGYNQSTYTQNSQGVYNGYNPYQQMSSGRPKTKKKKSGFGAKLAKCAAIALVFGLVAGGVFTGTSYVGFHALGINNSKESDSTASGSINNGGNGDAGIQNGSSVQQTATGMATDLADVSAIFDEVIPSIVAITNNGIVTYQTFWGTQRYRSESCGSGIIVSQDDQYLYIVTNNHVVENAETLTVQFCDDTTVSCEIRGTYPAKDLAVVRVPLSGIESDTRSTIKVATIGDSEALKVGYPAIAIGNALGYGQSLSCGHISALGRTITIKDESSGQTIVNNNMIQTSAAINPGNSGGALLNASGEVIGINSAKYSDTDVEGVGYAIPMADAVPIVNQLIESGKVVEPDSAYLGIQGQDISENVSNTYNMPVGIYVYQVIPDSAAEKAGIDYGDIITAFDGQKVSSMDELKTLLKQYEPGQQVTVTIQRLGGNRRGYEEMQVHVTLGAQNGVQ